MGLPLRLRRLFRRVPAAIPRDGVALDSIRLTTAARIAASAALAIAATVLVGWVANWQLVCAPVDGLPSMRFNTALGLALLATATLLGSGSEPARGAWRHAPAALALAAAALGLASLAQILSHVDLGIDTLVVADPATLAQGGQPGRMSAATATAMAMLGLGVALRRWRLPAAARLLVAVAGGIGATGLVSFLVVAPNLWPFSFFASMAMHSAAAFVLLSAAELLIALQDRLAPDTNDAEELQARWPEQRPKFAGQAAALVVGLGLTLLAANLETRQIRSGARARFDRLAERAAAEAQRRFNLPVYGLRGARAMYAADPSVDRAEFRLFVASRGLPNEFPGTLGFGFIQRVMRDDLDAFIATERADGAPDFAVRTSGDAPDLFVTKFIEPVDRNRAASGYDVGSEPIRRAAAERAIRTGEPTVSGRVALVQDAQRRPGFLYMLPVYRNGTEPKTPQEREGALVGLLYAPILIDEALSGFLDASEGELDIEAFDGQELTAVNLLLDADGQRVAPGDTVAGSSFGGRMFHDVQRMRVGGGEWSLGLSTTPVFEAGLDRTPVALVGLAGILLSTMLAAVVGSLGRERARAFALAREMTADLLAAKTRAENSLRETAALRSAHDQHSLSSVAEVSGRIIDVNDAFCRVSGYSREELLGKNHRIVNSGHHPKSFWVEMWQTISSGHTWHSDVCNRAKDGTLYWVDSLIAPFQGPDGRIEKYVSIRTDITERRRAEGLANQFGRLFEESFNEIYVFDAGSLNFLQVSEGAKKRLGYSLDELKQLTPVDLYPEFTRESFEDMIAPLRRGERPLLVFERVHRRKDGTTYPVEIRLQLMQDESPVFLAVVQDITERRQGEEQLARSNDLLYRTGEMAKIGGWELELPSRQLTWSRETYRIHEVEPETPVTLEESVSFYAPEARQQAIDALQLGLEQGQGWDLELQLLTARRRAIWVRAKGEAVVRDGEVIKLRGAFQDVTEQHEAREELARRASEMERLRNVADSASRAKSEFLANMSHEIRTPLTAILGYADLLRDDGELATAPARRIQTIDTILNAGQHLLTVINDILDLSKIEAGKMTVESVETSLVKLLAEVESLMCQRAAAKGVAFTVTLATPVPDRVMTDPTRLRQILMNLAGNAAKFTMEGSVNVSAGVAEQDGTAKLVIEVEDTGPGITSEQADHLFVAFSQADSTVTRHHGGTGLGLTITRGLAQLLGGDVTLAWTAPGRGSRFRAELPLVPAAGASMVSCLDVVQAETRPASASKLARLSGRILLAEDGPVNQRLICFHLHKAGARVDVAENGKVALEMLDESAANGRPYDLLLTDMQMPEMDGYTLARSLRARGSTLAIVALTAHAMAEDRQKCLDAGCDDYVSKPIDKVMLLETCAKWLGTATGKQA